MEHLLTKKTAILVDGGYYRVRAKNLWGHRSAIDRAQELYDYCLFHIREPAEPRELYRIFYYDCPPMSISVKHPLTNQNIDFPRLPGTRWSKNFFQELVEKRKVAFRKGELGESDAHFVLKDSVLEDLLTGKRNVDTLKEDDFRLNVKQKGVDMRIGLDVASLAYHHIVDQIILIAGDSDFLPVVKMARRNGIDVLLDPMKQFPKRTMQENVDGIESFTDMMCSDLM